MPRRAMSLWAMSLWAMPRRAMSLRAANPFLSRGIHEYPVRAAVLAGILRMLV